MVVPVVDLASSGRELPEGLGNIDARIELMHEFFSPPPHLLEIDSQPFFGDVVQAEILSDGEVGALREFLMHDADPSRERIIK